MKLVFIIALTIYCAIAITFSFTPKEALLGLILCLITLFLHFIGYLLFRINVLIAKSVITNNKTP